MMNTKSLLIDLQYLPSLAYFTCLFDHDCIYFAVDDAYQKQTCQSRCYITTSQKIDPQGDDYKVDPLIVPVHASSGVTKYSEVAIDQSQGWAIRHWRALKTAYGKAPYFEYFSDFFHPFFLNPPPTLLELNKGLLEICLQLLQVQKKLVYSSVVDQEQKDSWVDKRGIIKPRNESESYSFYKPVRYKQVFSKKFIANLSIIDLLFCEGPRSLEILEKSLF